MVYAENNCLVLSLSYTQHNMHALFNYKIILDATYKERQSVWLPLTKDPKAGSPYVNLLNIRFKVFNSEMTHSSRHFRACNIIDYTNMQQSHTLERIYIFFTTYQYHNINAK